MSGLRSEISVAAIRKTGATGRLLRLLSPIIDRVLGIRRLRGIYERHGLYGLERYAFLGRFIEREGLRYGIDEAELSRIPASGPVVVVANHPLGGLEAILLLWLLRLVRPDYKVLANVIDMFLVELEEFFIFTNPMAKGSSANVKSVRESREWLAKGRLLLVFPAGRVGLFRPDKGYVTDEGWDESALRLGLMTGATFVPLYVEGECSALFSFLSEYIYPMKLLFLLWEFLRSLDKRVAFHVGSPIPASRLAAMNRKKANAWLRMRAYLLCPPGRAPARRGGEATVGRLHPEVEDYIARYGLDEGEISELSGEAGADGQALREALRREEK